MGAALSYQEMYDDEMVLKVLKEAHCSEMLTILHPAYAP
jgi:hypothetical protein